MSKRAGKPLTWAQRNVLELLLQRGRTLRNLREGRWVVTTPRGRPTKVNSWCAMVLLEERAVEPTPSMTVRSFVISKRGREALETQTW